MKNSIVVNNVSKQYRIGKGLTNLRELFLPRREESKNHYHWAVRDLSFELDAGESLGIIGPNGAGKTTILKLLTQVTRPTSGSIQMHGRFSALIELGAGFHPDLTGRENIFLNGSILGMRRSEIRERFAEIVDFAGVGDYLDTPVKRYSSGMYARLGFSIAAHVDPQILLVDEVLAVGDYAFRQKCYARMDELRQKGTSLIFVSHDLDAVRQVCDKGLVMYRGENIFQGTAAEAVVAYSEAIRKAARQSQTTIPKEDGLSQRVMTFDAEVRSVNILDARGQPVTVIRSGDTCLIAMEVHFNRNVDQPIFAFTIRTSEGSLIYNTTTRWMKTATPNFLAGDRCRVEFTVRFSLLEGSYELGVDITASDLTHFYDRLESAMGFTIIDTSEAKGLVNLGAKFSYQVLSTEAETSNYFTKS